jgi:hypothetical protein
MTTTTLRTTPLDFDPIEILVDAYAEQARRSATMRSWADFRRRVFRVSRQVRFAAGWGL